MTEGESSNLRLTVQNFRGVRQASWAPTGVSALVGPNSSGKSTLLEAFLFLHYAAKRTPKDALNVSGGMQALLYHSRDNRGSDNAVEPAQIRLTAELGIASWSLEFSATNDNVVPKYDEEIRLNNEEYTQAMGAGVDMPPLLAIGRYLEEADQGTIRGNPFPKRTPEVAQLLERLKNLSLYRPWELQRFRRQPFSDPSLEDERLAPDGLNVFTVLQNWQNTIANGWRYEWVVKHLKQIHGQYVSGLELRKGSGVLGARFYAPDDEIPLPIKAASNGILSTLLTLTAAAGAANDGLILLDEPDNGLHPAAIRGIVKAFRTLHKQKNVHIVLASHSPVLLNAFNDSPEDVWVTELAHGASFPQRLTDLRDPDWLANFRLGNLYGSGFGRQDPLSGSEE